MGGQKSGPINLTTETNQSEPTSDKLQTNQTNRHRDVLLLSISISLYLCASISPYLCAYLRAYCSRISTQRPLRRCISPYPPLPYLGA